MLSCRGLCVSFAAENGTKSRGSGVPFALSYVTLDFAPGEVTGIAGCSGSGKSTLLRCLAGLLAPTSGTCTVDGLTFGVGTDATLPPQSKANPQQPRSAKNNSPQKGRSATASNTSTARKENIASRSYRERVGLVPQLPEEQLFARTVREEVAFGPHNLGLEEGEADHRTTWALESVGLDPAQFGDRNPFTLSGGEARRVAIANILALRPRYLLLDEPTAGLDPREAKRLLSLLAQLAQQGLGVVVVSHDLDALTSCCARAVLLRQGTVRDNGTARKVLGDASAVRTAGLKPATAVELAERLRRRGIDIPAGTITAAEIAAALTQDGKVERP